MSELVSALGLWEFSSIPAGIERADAIAKGTPVAAIMTGTTHPGKYVVIAVGDTASVQIAADIVNDRNGSVLDSVVLPDIAQDVLDALSSTTASTPTTGDAIGVIETATVAAGVDAADAAVKHARVELAGIRLADDLGGKAYFIVDGPVGEVEAAVEAARARTEGISDTVIIAQIATELRADLDASSSLADRLHTHEDV